MLKTSISTYCLSKRKRCLDVVIAIPLLILTLSLIPVIALFNYFVDKKTIFYFSRRIGLDGKEFSLLKFGTIYKTKKTSSPIDEHFTFLGKFLRRTQIDEIPQSINVFKGEMSIIGPRPYIVSECDVLNRKIPNFNARHRIRPGITGSAQLDYQHDNQKIGNALRKFQKDSLYVENATMWWDLGIIFRTIAAIITHGGR